MKVGVAVCGTGTNSPSCEVAVGNGVSVSVGVGVSVAVGKAGVVLMGTIGAIWVAVWLDVAVYVGNDAEGCSGGLLALSSERRAKRKTPMITIVAELSAETQIR